MFSNYFKTALRNLVQNEVYSFINMAGLSIGLAYATPILLYVTDEMSFDQFHKNTVDPNFFSVFTFPLLSGDTTTCLTEPHSIVLSEDAAKKYFATTGAVDKVLMIKENASVVRYKVTAVAKRCPQNSSIQLMRCCLSKYLMFENGVKINC